MEFRAGVIIIGSLVWDQAAKRKTWRSGLDVSQRIQVKLPIRYGRKSRLTGVRKGTYTMVFSNSMEANSTLGCGLVVPLKSLIRSDQDLRNHALELSDAEGISNQTISKDWGTVSIAINPFIDAQRRNEIENLWTQVINYFVGMNGYQNPELKYFGENNETRSITNTLKLNINLESLFSQCPGFDILLATSNAVKLNDAGTNVYPTVNRIAAAIYENDYYAYFLSNRLYSIKTFEDIKISKILKNKYRMKLKPKREQLRRAYRQ